MSYDGLKLAVSTAGMYEFKILATDKVGNSMYCYLDGYKTKVTSDTIWKTGRHSLLYVLRFQ